LEARAGGCCEYCRSPVDFATEAFAAEHIRLRSRGGKTSLKNLAFSCQGCNSAKYNKVKGRDPETGWLASLYNPRKDRWRHHFAWNNDCTLIVGLTPVGWATVATLRLNRVPVVNLRKLLAPVGRHPPPEPEPGT
jgi:hypothetical protein